MCAALLGPPAPQAQRERAKRPRLSDPAAGREAVSELIAQRPDKGSEIYAKLRIRDGEGRRSEIYLRYTIVAGDESWQGIYETRWAGNIPAEKVVITHHGTRPNEYRVAVAETRGEPPGEAIPAAREKTFIPLGGTDFWIADLGLEFFHWPDQVLVDKEMRKSRSCKVVESINPHPELGGYSRVLSWIDNESGGLVMAQAFDARSKLLKEFSVGKVKKVNGRWQVKELEIRNTQTDSRTTLEFELEVEADPDRK